MSKARPKVREVHSNGHDYFAVTIHPPGEKEQTKHFKNREDAEALADKVAQLRAESQPVALLSNRRLMELVGICYRRFGEQFFVELLSEKVRSVKDVPVMPECAALYVKSLVDRGLSDTHIATVRLHLKDFTSSVASTTYPDNLIEENFSLHLADIDNPKTRLNVRTTLVAFFNWLLRRGWVRQNVAERTEVPKCPVSKPEIFTPEEMRKLLACPREHVKLFLVLGGFFGVRTAEAHRLKWSDWKSGSLVLDPSITKTARRRVISAESSAWMESLRRTGYSGTMLPNQQVMRRLINNWCKECGVGWKPNALRHSYASYHLELHSNAALTSKNLGHDSRTLETTYLQLVDKEQARDWFSILPD